MDTVKSEIESGILASTRLSITKLVTEVQMKRTVLLAIGAVAVAASACAEPEPSLLLTGHVPQVGASLEEGVLDTSGCSAPNGIDDVEDEGVGLEQESRSCRGEAQADEAADPAVEPARDVGRRGLGRDIEIGQPPVRGTQHGSVIGAGRR